MARQRRATGTSSVTVWRSEPTLLDYIFRSAAMLVDGNGLELRLHRVRVSQSIWSVMNLLLPSSDSPI